MHKSWIIGVGGAVLLLAIVMLAVWFFLAPPITKESAEQHGNYDVTLSVETIVSGLKNPWDTAFLPDSTLLFSEREGEVSKLIAGRKVVIQKIDDVQAQGEGGLTGLALDSDFMGNRYLYTCYNSTAGDVRVVRWQLNESLTELNDKKVLVDGIPSNSSGRHSGCRLKSAADGALWVGTGDAAQSSHPQDLRSLGGKILHVTRDGEAIEGNIESGDKRIFNYGHRNIQGITLFDKPVDGVYGFSIEHGSNENDEVNLITSGNFGWDPLPPYDESVPMTDLGKFPDAIQALWSSGESTIAPSGGDIVRGENWGRYNGALAMAVLKNQQLRMLTFDLKNDYKLTNEETFFERDFGRIRSATMGPDGNLYLTTDNGIDDKILRVTPQPLVKSAKQTHTVGN
jgi:glucose/arabinose dehydrogenase